jgi:hypothetical protein
VTTTFPADGGAVVTWEGPVQGPFPSWLAMVRQGKTRGRCEQGDQLVGCLVKEAVGIGIVKDCGAGGSRRRVNCPGGTRQKRQKAGGDRPATG